MVQVHTYRLAPTALIPNSPRPLLHYKRALASSPDTGVCDAAAAWALFTDNGWRVSWIFRYGQTQASHFHSQAHECMAVLSGTATIRFGEGDTSPDLAASTFGGAREGGGVELHAEAGDVFVIPAGVAHKTFDARPEADFVLLSPGRGRGIEAEDPRGALAGVQLSGFTMLGAYASGEWDFVKAGGEYERVWSVPKPAADPVFGGGEEGLCRLWLGSDAAADVEMIILPRVGLGQGS
ncbi:hypothetical protein ACHAQA_007689 [Verticillium albo-atrum]